MGEYTTHEDDRATAEGQTLGGNPINHNHPDAESALREQGIIGDGGTGDPQRKAARRKARERRERGVSQEEVRAAVETLGADTVQGAMREPEGALSRLIDGAVSGCDAERREAYATLAAAEFDNVREACGMEKLSEAFDRVAEEIRSLRSEGDVPREVIEEAIGEIGQEAVARAFENPLKVWSRLAREAADAERALRSMGPDAEASETQDAIGRRSAYVTLAAAEWDEVRRAAGLPVREKGVAQAA